MGPDGVANRFLEAVGRRDYAALASCFAPDARLRGLVPARVREEEGPQAIADRYRIWLGDADEYEVPASSADELLGLVRLRYLVRTIDPETGAPTEFEQTGYAQIVHGRIAVLNLVCTGNRPATT